MALGIWGSGLWRDSHLRQCCDWVERISFDRAGIIFSLPMTPACMA
jgi:hypothetical protein